MRTLVDVLPADRNNFGLLRLIAAASVIVSHSYVVVNGERAGEPLLALTGFSLGQHAVNVFFVTSGLLVAASLVRSRSLADYARARVLRIYPGLVVCLLFCAFAIGLAATKLPPGAYLTDSGVYGWLLRTGTLLSIATPLPGVFTDTPYPAVVNLPLWTLKYEIACYIVLGAVGAAGLLHRRAMFLTAYAGLVLLYGATLTVPAMAIGNASLAHLLHFATLFGFGVAAYLLRERLVLSWFWLLVAMVAYAAAFTGPLRPLGTVFLTGYATLALAALPVGVAAVPFRRFDLSYGMYIYGFPIQQFIVDLFPGVSIAVVAAGALLVTGGLAALSWILVEKPMLALRHRPFSLTALLDVALHRNRRGDLGDLAVSRDAFDHRVSELREFVERMRNGGPALVTESARDTGDRNSAQ